MRFRQLFTLLLAVAFLTSCSYSGKNEIVNSNQVTSKDSCCSNDAASKDTKMAVVSEITCPKCGHKEMENMPTDVCLLSYECKHCKTVLTPKGEDCCVFCTYGTVKCPSKQ